MEVWAAAALFFGGALCYRFIAILLDLGHMHNTIKATTDQIILLLVSTSQDIAFIKSIKYETMETMDLPEEQIELVKKIDKETFRIWKDLVHLKMFDLFPKAHKKILTQYKWDKITKSIDELYK